MSPIQTEAIVFEVKSLTVSTMGGVTDAVCDKTFHRSARAGCRVLRGAAAIAIRSAVRPPLIAVAAISLAAFEVADLGPVSPAFTQTPSPVTLRSVFEPDVADIRPDAIGKLQEAAKKAHRDCYPPRATFKVVVPASDPAFAKALGQARAKALAAALPSLGLDPGQFKTEWAVGGNDDVQVSYDKFTPDDDKEAPKLKVTSTPRKGTPVKVGDQIKVTITASERYEDGHKSWPTGVLSIQLIADDGLVDSKDYGRVPPPCERRTFEPKPYTVPRNQRIVHLRAIAEDGVGNNDSEVAEFPVMSSTGGKKPLPPWFNNCDPGDIHTKCIEIAVYNQGGPMKDLTDTKHVTCHEQVFTCDGWIEKPVIITPENHQECPDKFAYFGLSPNVKVTMDCNKFKEAKRTHKPCDPTDDWDCDGVPNEQDAYPFDPNRSRPGDATLVTPTSNPSPSRKISIRPLQTLRKGLMKR